MKTVEYEIGTGAKSDFYTLWRTTIYDFRPRNEKGEIVETTLMRNLCPVYISFIQNLGKTIEQSKLTLDKLGVSLDDEAFDFNLKHYIKPSFEAFGTRLKFKKDKWFAPATKEFFEAWKSNKDQLKDCGWSCWKYQDRLKNEMWYMSCKLESDGN